MFVGEERVWQSTNAKWLQHAKCVKVQVIHSPKPGKLENHWRGAVSAENPSASGEWRPMDPKDDCKRHLANPTLERTEGQGGKKAKMTKDFRTPTPDSVADTPKPSRDWYPLRDQEWSAQNAKK